MFQLPRIAKPSGTHRGSLPCANTVTVSTSPDSKAIRNLVGAVGCIEQQFGVSTSPDSKAIRNPGVTPGDDRLAIKVSTSPDSKAIRNPSKSAVTNPHSWFQLPRIAKPSGTHVIKSVGRDVQGLVSTSPDSKAIRNPKRPEQTAQAAAAGFNFPG